MNQHEVAVTGLGAICSAGLSLPEAMTSLYAGRRAAAAPVNIKVDLDDEYPVFEVLSPLAELHSAGKSRTLTRTCTLAIIAIEEALRHAKLTDDDLHDKRVGVCLGTTVGCTLNDEEFYREYRSGRCPAIDPVERYLNNNPAKLVADVWQLEGPAATIANACSSGTDAIGLGKSWLETDQCDLVIAGGCDELSRIPYLGFIRLMNTSREACKPFDSQRKGLNLGEGAAIVILERRGAARSRLVKDLAYVRGYASAADAYHPTAPHPEGRGLREATRLALVEAGVDSIDIGFFSAHGTATPDNDRVEGRVIESYRNPGIPVVATKAFTGHTLGAAGALQAVFAVQSLCDQRLPPTPGFVNRDPEIGLSPTVEATSIDARWAMMTSLAFGGQNSALVLRRGDE